MQTIKTGYKQTDIGIIPEDWEVITFGKTFDFLSTANYPRDELSNEGEISYVHYGDIHTKHNHFLNFENASLPTISLNQVKKYTILQDGDLLMADASEDYNGICKSVEIKNIDGKKAISGLHTFLLRDNKNTFANGFKGYIHSNKLVKTQFERLATGLKVYGVSKGNLKSIQIPVPPLKEQKRIAQVLSDMDGLITNLEELIAKKQSLKQGAMQELLKPKEGWEVKRIKDIASISTGSKNTQDKVNDGSYPFYVRSQTIERINSFSFDGEAVLTAGDGVGIGKVIHYVNEKFDIHQRVYKISNFDKIILGFYFFLYFKHNFYERIMQMTAKSSVDSIRLEMLSEMPILIPSLSEQNKIVKILSEIDEEITVLESKRGKYQQFRTGMMQELLTGQVRLI